MINEAQDIPIDKKEQGGLGLMDNNNEDELLLNALYIKVEESKKSICRYQKEYKEQIKRNEYIKRYINQYQQEINTRNEAIYLLNDQLSLLDPSLSINPTYIFKENIFDDKDNLYHVLQLFKQITKHKNNHKYLWLKKYEQDKSISIMKSEKYKFLQFCREIYEGISKVVYYDSAKFSEYQLKISSLMQGNTSKGTYELYSSDQSLFEKISISIHYKTVISDIEIDNWRMFIGEGDSDVQRYKIAVIEYDSTYEIIKKYSMLELKVIVCKYFNVDHSKYFIVDQNFLIWPFDTIIYNELFNLNVEHYGIKPHSRFFQFKSNITEGLTFVIVHQMEMLKLLLHKSWLGFRFVDYCNEARQSLLAKHMMAKLNDISSDPEIYRALAKVKNEQKNAFTVSVLQQEMIELFRKIKNERKHKERENDMTRLDGESVMLEQNNYGISKVVKEQLEDKYENVLRELNMDINNLMQYFDELANNPNKAIRILRNIKDSRINGDDEEYYDENNNNRKGIECIVQEILENSNNGLIPVKYLQGKTIHTSDDYFYMKLLKYYLHIEQKEIEEVKESFNNALQNAQDANLPKKDKQNKETFSHSNTMNQSPSNNNINDKVLQSQPFILKQLIQYPIILPIIQMLIIISFMICSLFAIGNKTIISLNQFKSQIEDIFTKETSCLNQWSKIQSHSSLNPWIKSCLCNTFKSHSLQSPFNKGYKSLGFDMKITSRKIHQCNSASFNLTFPLKNNPKCLNKADIEYISTTKKKLFQMFQVKYQNDYTQSAPSATSFFNTLFFPNVNLLNATLISVFDYAQYDRFHRMISFTDKYNCLVKNNDESCKTYYEEQYVNGGFLKDFDSKDTSFIRREFNDDDSVGRNTVDLIDYSTLRVIFDIYFINKEYDLLSVMTFDYNAGNEEIMTSVKSHVLMIERLTFEDVQQYIKAFERIAVVYQSNSNSYSNGIVTNDQLFYTKLKPFDTTFLIGAFQYVLLILIINTSYFSYKINLITKSSNSLFLNNIFLFLFYIESLIEIIVALHYRLSGCVDYMFLNQLILTTRKFDGPLYQDANFRILKAFGFLALMYHAILIIFPYEKLVVFNVFRRTVFQRFLFLVLFINIALAFLINVTIGRYYEEYGTFGWSFWRVLTNSFGVNHSGRNDYDILSYNVRNWNECFNLILTFMRIIVMNFSMCVIVFYVCREEEYKRRRKEKTMKIV